MKNTTVILIGIILSCAIFTTSGWCDEARKVEEKTFDFSMDGNISLTADDGSITIRTWDKEKVYLKMTMRAWGRNRREAERLLDEVEVRIQEGRNRLVIKVHEHDYDDNFNFFDIFDGEFWREHRWRGGIVDFELTVPKRVNLKLRTDEGDIDVQGTEGKLTIDVDEGNVDVEDVLSNNVQIGVDEGDISLYNVIGQDDGFVKIDSDEGAIFIEDTEMGDVDVRTDEGEIDLRSVQTPRFWLTTDEGDIRADLRPMKDGSYRMESDEGDLEIFMPKNVNLQVRLQTYEGRIDSDFDLSIRGHDDGESMEGVIGRNEGMLRAYTDEGDIVIRNDE